MFSLRTRSRIYEWLVTLPSLLWLLLLFVVPTLIVFAMALKPADPYGGIGTGWTLETLKSLGNPNYPAILWRTFWLSVATTLICVAVAVPIGYYLALAQPAWRRFLLLLIIVPFWTSFLIRIFAWKVLLHPDGAIKRFLTWIGLVDANASLLYNSESVLLVMVYTFLPFAILPVFAAAEKFDFRLIEAARDLGANSVQSFSRIFIPGISRGIWTAILVVFIPALGSYVIPDIVGGPNSEMLGNKIAQRTFSDRNWPHASALAALLTIAVLIPLIARFLRPKRKEAGPIIQEDS